MKPDHCEIWRVLLCPRESIQVNRLRPTEENTDSNIPVLSTMPFSLTVANVLPRL